MTTNQNRIGSRSLLSSRSASGLAAAAVVLLGISGCGGSGSSGSHSFSSSGGSSSSGGDSGDSGGSGGANAQLPSEVRGSGLVSFQMINGQANWQAGSENKAVNSVLDLESGGSCQFNVPDTVGSPMPCTYTVSGNQISFSGSDTTPGAAGSFSLQVDGSVNLANHTMQIDYTGGSGMAAVVDNQDFSESNSIHWSAVVRASF
jgi:hypothetical protein